MKKSLCLKFGKTAVGFLALCLNLFAACEIGLGPSVDTDPPVLTIENPPVDAIVRDVFAIQGSWEDDGAIASVTVTLKRPDGFGSEMSYEAEITETEEKGIWYAVINPFTEGVLDGTYEATVEISDEAGHVVSQSRTFTVDNTAPLIVLQRPGTKITEPADAYGQTFSLNGMGADDNTIDHIDVEIYSDEACTNLLKTITKSNVPPTIELDVAVFEEGVSNDYSEIYGSVTKNGTQYRYCKITAYDNAKRYPLERTGSTDEETGNSTSTYYLYDDIYSGVLENNTITDVYKMLSGTYLFSNNKRDAGSIEQVVSILGNNEMEKSNFSLNPENNPLFFVNGKDVLRKDGADFTGSDYLITNGSSVVVEISTGLDGISLNAASLRPYLLPCDANGNASVDNIPENRIYLSEAGVGAKSGTSYKFTVTFDTTLSYAESKTLTLGHSYIFGVEGTDQRGNTVIPKGGTYGFKLSSNGAAPGLTVTNPIPTISYVGAGGSQTFAGTVNCQDGTPVITIKKGTETVYTHQFTESEATVENGLREFTFNTTISYADSENSQNQYTFTASQDGLETTAFKTVIYDKDAPTISVGSILPLAKKYNPEVETNTPSTEDYLNGNITLRFSLNDEYDTVETSAADKKPYFEVIEVNNGIQTVKPLIVTGPDVVSETSATAKHYITKLINGSFQIDTTQIQTGSDDKSIIFKIYAWDRAGNAKIYTYPEPTATSQPVLKVNQQTDYPVILPTNNDLSLKYTSKAQRDAATARRSQVPSGGQLLFTIIDDDGIGRYKILSASVSNDNPTETADQVADSRFNDAEWEDGNGSTQLTVTKNSSTASGYYWYKVLVEDTKATGTPVTTVKGPFIVKVTTAAPILVNVTTLDSDSSDINIGKYVGATGAEKTKWRNKIEINATEAPFYLYRSETPFAEDFNPDPPTSTVGSPDGLVYVTPQNTVPQVIYDTIANPTANKTYYYMIYDSNINPSNVKTIDCQVDTSVPSITIANPGNDTAKTGVNAINTSSYQFSGSIQDDNTISSIAGIYYKTLAITEAAPTAPASNRLSASTWTAAGWEAVSPGTSWSFVIGSETSPITQGKYKLYMYAIDGAGNLSDSDSATNGNQPYSRVYHIDMANPVVTETSSTRYVNAAGSGNVSLGGTITESHGIQSFTVSRGTTTYNIVSNGTVQTAPSGVTWSYTAGTGAWSLTETPGDGNYTYTITATDLVGKPNASLTRQVTVDTTVPTVSPDTTKFKVPAATETQSSLFKFEGLASNVTDAGVSSGLDKVEIAFTARATPNATPTAPTAAQETATPAADGSWQATVEFNTAKFGTVFSGTNAQGTKDLWVKVYDKAGNSSAWTNAKHFVYDTAAPTISLTGTTPQANTYRREGFTIQASASDTYGVQGVSIAYGTGTGQSVAAPYNETSGKYEASFRVDSESGTATHLDDGKYTFTATVTDRSGKTASVDRLFTIDTTVPVISLVKINGTEVTANADNSTAWYKSQTIPLIINASDALSGISTVEYATQTAGSTDTLEETDWNPLSLQGSEYKGSAIFSGTGAGQKLYIRVKDNAGNIEYFNTNNAALTINIDTDKPNLSITQDTILTYIGTTGFTVHGTASDSPAAGAGIASLNVKEYYKGPDATDFTLTSDSGTNGVSVTRTNEEWEWSRAVPLGTSQQNSTNGTYKYVFTLTDNAGNFETAQFTATVDKIAPVINIETPDTDTAKTGENAINSSSYQFSGTITELNTVSKIYYKVLADTATAPSAPASNIMDDSSWTGWTAVTSGKSWSFVIGSEANPITQGKYKLYMYAIDGAGNLSALTSRIYHVDMAKPVVTESGAASRYVNAAGNGSVSLGGTITESHGIQNFTVSRVKEGTSETTTYNIVSNGEVLPVPTVNNQSGVSWTYTATSTGANWSLTEAPGDGNYTYTITATDLVGKTNESLTREITVDTTVPTVNTTDQTKFKVPTSTETQSSLFKFEGLASNVTDTGASGTAYSSGIDKVEIAFTARENPTDTPTAPTAAQESATPAANGSWQSTVEFANTKFGIVFTGAQGTKDLWVKVYDKAGNASAWTNVKNFVYDTAAPTISLTGATPQANSYKKTGFVIEASASDSYGVQGVNVAYGTGTGQSVAATLNETSGKYEASFRVGSETGSATLLADGEYTFTATVTDLSGKTASVDRHFTVDTTAPVISLVKINGTEVTANADNSSVWYRSQTIPLIINASDAVSGITTSGIASVEYATQTAGSTAALVESDWTPLTLQETEDGTEYKGSAIFSGTGAGQKLYIRVKDNAGNITYFKANNAAFTINIDTTAPELSALYYQVGTGTAAGAVKGVSSTIYVKSGTSITVYGKYKDEQSGVQALTFTRAGTAITPSEIKYTTGTVTEQTTTTVPALSYETYSDSNSSSYTYWKATFSMNEGGEFGINGKNGTYVAGTTGGQTSITPFTVTIDDTKPNLSNYKLLTSANTEAYKKTVSGQKRYYINNTTSTALIISGVATDNIGVEKVTLSINGTSYNNTGTASDWKFENIDLSSLTNVSGETADATATITVTDVAGNQNTVTAGTEIADKLYIYFDTTAPLGHHELDTESKDLTFRIGENNNDDITSSSTTPQWSNSLDTGVGKKYSDDSYGNSSTITISGNIGDSESGVSLIYYHVFDKPIHFDSDLAANVEVPHKQTIEGVANYVFRNSDELRDYVISNSTSDPFAPLETAESKRVFYTGDATHTLDGTLLSGSRYYKNINTTYRSTISGFNYDKNYLVIAAVDNVGNKGIDYVTVSSTVQHYFCQINKDNEVPSISLDAGQDSMRYYNGSSENLTLSGVATDSLAGIRSVSFKVNNHEITTTDSTYGTITLVDSGTYSKQNTHWSVTINPSAFEGASTDDINFYGIVTDDAGVGNQQMLSLATFIRDIDGPEVTLNSPKDADISTSNIIEVNKLITLNGTASDINGLSTSTNMELYFTKSSTLGNVTTAPTLTTGTNGNIGTDAETKWVSIDDTKSHSNSWSFGGINTATLGGSTIADGTEVYFTVKATDKAGNSSCAVPVKVTVDQNTDRPILSYNNLSWDSTANSNAGGVKEYNKNLSTLSGIITDDDGITELRIAVAATKPADFATNSAYVRTVNSTGAFSVPLGDDGTKKLWIYVKDTAGTEFITAATAGNLSQPYLVFNGNTSKHSDSAATSFIINNTSPVITHSAFGYGNTETAATTAATTTTSSAYSAFTNTSYAGGTVRKYVVFAITATTSNNVPVESVKVSVSGISAPISFPVANKSERSGNAETWYTDPIDISAWTHGNHTLSFTVEDASGLSAISEPKQFIIDNMGPSVSLISPRGEEVTNPVSLEGTATDDYDHAVSKIGFVIVDNRYYNANGTFVTNAQNQIKAAAKTAADTNNRTGTTSSWNFTLNGVATQEGKVNPSLPTSEGSGTGGIENAATGINRAPVPQGYGEDDDTRNLTVVFYTCDELGNESWTPIVRDTTVEDSPSPVTIVYNPFADRPSASVTYPLGAYVNEENVENYSNLNGDIRVTGSARDNVSISNGKVFIQLDLNKDGLFDNQDLALLQTLSYTTTSGGTSQSHLIYTVTGNTLVTDLTSVEGVTDTAALGTNVNTLWGIPVRGTNSWNITINSYNELQQIEEARIGNADSGQYKIGIRAVAMDDGGTFGSWSAKQYFKIDLNAPSIGAGEIVATDDSGTVIANQIAEKYVQDMYLSGNKKLRLKISDRQGLKKVTYTYATTIEGLSSSQRIGTIEKAELDTIKPATQVEGMYVYTIDIPLSLLTGSAYLNSKTVALKVVATKDSDTETTSYERYLVHFDNDKATIKKLTLNSVEHTGSSNAADNKIVNSNLFFTIGGLAEDTGAGFDRMSFYFIRNPRAGSSTATRIYDVLSANQAIPVSGLDTKTVTTNSGNANDTTSNTFTIYGKNQTGLTVADEGLSLTGYTTDSHVHEGGYVQIGSKWHKIESISGTTVNLTTATSATGTQTVFFAYLQTIDNTGSERRDDDDSTTITGDDNDGMCESIRKSQTNWDYDASFDSTNIPDGPGKLVVFVYDKAGNVSAKEYPVSVQNNAPRLTKLWLATDLSGDGTFQDIASEGITEIVEYNVLSKVGEQTNYKDLNTVDYHGEHFIAKNKMAVIPEFTGGNGAIKMALNNNAATSTAITSYATDEAAAAAGALYTSQGATAVPGINNFTLARTGDTTWAYVIDNDTLRPSSPTTDRVMSFTFWDSTEETAPGVDSNWCYLRIKDLRVNVDDVTAPKVVVSPFYWNSKSKNSLYKNSSNNGHIELEDDLPTTVFTATSGLLDRDPKVSGKITIRGTAFDDYTLSSIWVAFDGFTPATGTYTDTKTLDSLTYYKVASYTGGSWECESPSDTATVEGATWAFKVTNNYIRASGHKASWQLDIDTSGITGRMGLDKKVYVRAIDATGDAAGAAATVVTAHTSNLTATGTADSEDSVYSKPTYRMDIVPYITKVLDENSNTATRSRLGRYPVRMGKSIYLEGFNFGDGTLSVKRHKTVNGIASTTAETDTLTATRVTGDNNRIKITAAPDYSGFLNLTITPTGGTALTAINNSNSASGYNIQKGYDADEEDNAGNKTYGRLTANAEGTNFWTDDVYLSVWNVADASQFNGSINPHSGVIKKLTTQNSGSGAPNNTNPGNNGHITAAAGPGGGYIYKQPGYSTEVTPETGMNDSYYAAMSSDDLKLYGYVSGRNYTTLGHGDNIAFNSSEVAYVAPVDEMDYTIVNGMPYYVFQDNGLGGDSGSVWGLGLVMMREGIWYDRNYFNPYKGNTIEEAKLPYFVERQGYNKASWQRDSSTGYDSILYQFKNPRITGWYNANESLLYTKQGGNKYIDGVDYIYISYFDSYAKCLKYAAYKVGHRFATNDSKYSNTALKEWGKIDVDHDIDIVAKMSSSPNTAGNQPDQTTYNHMTDGKSVVAGADTTSNNPNPTTVAGEWSDIFVDSTSDDPIPVIVYYNKTAKSLEIARGNNSFPQGPNEWTKTLAIRPTGVSSDFGRYVSGAMDTAGNLHIAAQDADNSILYYLYLTKSGNTYTVSKSIAVDGSAGAGRWADIELTDPAGTSLAAIAPVISYIDTSFMGTTKGIKVAYLVGTETDGTPIFEAMTDPARYAPSDQRTSVMADVKETKNATSKATIGVGFNSDMLALDFLRGE